MHGNVGCTADVIPVDTATNAMIAVAWYTAIERLVIIVYVQYRMTTILIMSLTWGDCNLCAISSVWWL